MSSHFLDLNTLLSGLSSRSRLGYRSRSRSRSRSRDGCRDGCRRLGNARWILFAVLFYFGLASAPTRTRDLIHDARDVIPASAPGNLFYPAHKKVNMNAEVSWQLGSRNDILHVLQVASKHIVLVVVMRIDDECSFLANLTRYKRKRKISRRCHIKEISGHEIERDHAIIVEVKPSAD
jgi:hypothetical protein